MCDDPRDGNAERRPLRHGATGKCADVFIIDVAQDARQRGRYRWSVSENMKVRDTSFYPLQQGGKPKPTQTSLLKS